MSVIKALADFMFAGIGIAIMLLSCSAVIGATALIIKRALDIWRKRHD